MMFFGLWKQCFNGSKKEQGIGFMVLEMVGGMSLLFLRGSFLNLIVRQEKQSPNSSGWVCMMTWITFYVLDELDTHGTETNVICITGISLNKAGEFAATFVDRNPRCSLVFFGNEIYGGRQYYFLWKRNMKLSYIMPVSYDRTCLWQYWLLTFDNQFRWCF